MNVATSGTLIVPAAQGLLRVHVNTIIGYLDILCFYSLHFTSNLLSDRDLLRSSPHSKKFSGQVMTKYFDLNNEILHQDLMEKGCVDLQKQTCIHNKLKRNNIEIPGIV